MGAPDGLDHGLAPAVGHVDVDEHDVGDALGDELDGRSHLVGVPHHLDGVAELGSHTREEKVVVVDQEHAHLRPGPRLAGPVPHSRPAPVLGMTSSTSVPWPGALRMTAVPPWRVMRARMDSAMPCRSVADRVGVEARAPVAHEHRHLGRLDLDEERHARCPRPLRGVDRRLAARRQQGPELGR